ncbi:unnamed protein product [Darwinula stevensoni]|uniref:ATP synthase mitochondrial F1 complex assembly factor 1 n=1 Tax=Darwinula stevensoni TaxID=69355 RepID=A0A7R8X872_9CRUS|nr:unnamed protein product [Darwinula stevensoni]CAG0883054.1 unnamed protein product [Darwinula stevensoni]
MAAEEELSQLQQNPFFEKYASKIAAFQQCVILKFPSMKLEDILKVDLIAGKTADEVQQIWEEYHKGKENYLAAVVPPSIFQRINETASKYPLFLLPLPRKQGYEFFFLQYAGDEFHFTSLINYQAFQENAPDCLVLHYYKELADEKGLILLRGEFDSKVLTGMEAQCLANQVQLYYGSEDATSPKRQKLLDTFNVKPSEFKHMDLISFLEFPLS